MKPSADRLLSPPAPRKSSSWRLGSALARHHVHRHRAHPARAHARNEVLARILLECDADAEKSGTRIIDLLSAPAASARAERRPEADGKPSADLGVPGGHWPGEERDDRNGSWHSAPRAGRRCGRAGGRDGVGLSATGSTASVDDRGSADRAGPSRPAPYASVSSNSRSRPPSRGLWRRKRVRT